MQKFQFRILTGDTEAECRSKYDALADKTTHLHDSYTFYLFDKGGIGYLGDTALFGGDASKFNMVSSNLIATDLKTNTFYFVTADCTITDGQATPVVHQAKAGSIWVTNSNSVPSELSLTIFNTYMAKYIAEQAILSSNANLNANYAGTDATIMSSKAIVDLINAKLNAQDILNIAFFSNVSETVTLTSTDITNTYVEYTFTGDSNASRANLTNNDHEGDIGIIFKCQVGSDYDESENDGDECIFINLHALINLYVPDSSAQTTTTTIVNDSANHTKKIKTEVKKSTVTASDFESMILYAVDAVLLNREDSTNPDYDPTDSNGDNLSNNKFITESQLADILAHVLSNFVQVEYVGPISVDPIVDDGGDL